MAKIGIIEDELYDAKKKYARLNKDEHEIHLVMYDHEEEEFKKEMTIILLTRESALDPELKTVFCKERIYFDIEQLPQMDIYFCDT